MAKREFTAVYKKHAGQYIAWLEEIPGVNTQGRTKNETRENLKEALALILEVNRKIALKRFSGSVLREPFRIEVPA